ncbi:F-BAR domain only protein 2 isoform X4 [Sitodiplosis mosellana]|uniref:F-BAR domain only protein 2 isoform X4 n=1 Tax=Sitodiplosis mosellana TaxID=263140 RepID=UPI002444E914|nr:F-BAR domain only protein 2 isoform X4 [Sitodiplosis mosellana]XP_055325319.1 F-BAR domain only protein 2 isoform X4 [Sitodiplosis mosellana]
MTVDFNDYFWGDKNNGFDVLYHNMKYGLVASKELSEFFREKSNIEESNSKLMTKLANKAGSGCVQGTFAPVWVVLKSSAEKLSSLHLQMVHKISELVKDVSKYADELHKKHKSVKEEEASTLEAVQAMQASTAAVQKAKDLFSSRMNELEKIRKDGSAKELEKAESKLRKHQDEYKQLLDKHNPVKMEFERRMSMTCKRFQDIEENHLKQMKEFLSTYIELLQNNHDMVGQVHSEFRRQFLEMTVDKLLEQFVLSKYTGLEKPEIVELDLTHWSPSNTSLNATQPSASHSMVGASTNSVASAGSGIGSIHLTNVQLEYAPTASPELSLTNTGSSVSNNQSTLGMGTTTKREPYLRNWFMSQSSASSHSANAISNIPSHANTGNSVSATASPAASSLNAISTESSESNYQKMKQFSLQQLHTADNIQLPIDNSSSTSSVLSSQHHSSITTNTNRKATTNGEQNGHNSNMNNSHSHSADVSVRDEPQKQSTSQPKQQKSSRRTTSLLNLFMSNSQGSRDSRDSRESRGSRDSNSIEVLSAPSSPSEQQDTQNQSSSQIGRNPLRSSKFSAILRSGRNKTKSKKSKKKKDSANDDTISGVSGVADTSSAVVEEKEDVNQSVESTPHTTPIPTNTTAPPPQTPNSEQQPEVDEDGYCIQPKDPLWNVQWPKKDSDSDSDSDNDERDRKIHVEIKPLNNGSAPISASVDELRATVESFTLSPLGGALSHHQSPGQSNSSTPTASHPYAPLQSPTLSVSNTSRYTDLGDIFSEIGDISVSAPPSATSSKLNSRQIPTPTSAGSIAIPRPPSRRSEATGRGRVSPSSISRADSVGSLEFRTASIGFGSSRGPSPLTIGITDTIPLAVAFHEIVHAFFKGSDEARCQVKMSGDMMLSFPAGIVNVLANNPNPAQLGFRIKNMQNLENLSPNKQLVAIDKLQSTSFSTLLEFNMPALTALLRRQSEQNPTASYFNVDILKYQIKAKMGAQSCPFQLVSYWKCEPSHTDIKIDYKYNNHAMAASSPLLNVALSVPVDGGVKNVQSKPHSAWLGESNRLMWNFTDISQHSDNNGVGTLRARLDVSNGPSNPSLISTQFNCEGTTLSGIEFELVGSGYRLSLVKRRFVSGKYICEGDGIRSIKTPTPPNANSPSPFSRPS